MTPKNTICLWFNKDAEAAARFYAATFPDSTVTAVRTAPCDYPGGKEGDQPAAPDDSSVRMGSLSSSSSAPKEASSSVAGRIMSSPK